VTPQRTSNVARSAHPVPAEAHVGSDPRITALEARVEHLESTLEGLQDAVYRQSVLEGRQIAELSRRTEPHEMARALSQDARRHGV
jgi:uncharacterized coiled-coil protein SlyX